MFFFDLRLNKRLSKHNQDTGDLRYHQAHYDIAVMFCDLAALAQNTAHSSCS